jgi:hypothetical protein
VLSSRKVVGVGFGSSLRAFQSMLADHDSTHPVPRIPHRILRIPQCVPSSLSPALLYVQNAAASVQEMAFQVLNQNDIAIGLPAGVGQSIVENISNGPLELKIVKCRSDFFRLRLRSGFQVIESRSIDPPVQERFRAIALSALILGGIATMACAQTATRNNLASQAVMSASGSLSEQYIGKYTATGHIPPAGSRNDAGKAWCIPQDQADGATLTYKWEQAVTVREIVYYGRTAWRLDENYRRVSISTAIDQPQICAAPLRRGHGPQRVTLDDPLTTDTLVLRFSQPDSGPNPGASEIKIFAEAADQAVLGDEFVPLAIPGVSANPDLFRRFSEGELGFDSLLVIQRQSLRPTHVYTYHNEDFRPGGGLYRWHVDGRLEKLLDAGQGQLLDLQVSYDGTEVLFSWRRSRDETYQIYRMRVDGSELVQLSEGEHYNFNPAWLPDGSIAFLSTRAAAYAYCWDSPVGVLHRMDRDGSNVIRLSANYLNDIAPRFWGSPASRLADLILSGHPDENGVPRIDMEDNEKRRIFAWIDLNVPYYGTSQSNHLDRRGNRHMWPPDFDKVFAEVSARRCISCHSGGPPRQWYLRVEKPEYNNFMLAPLARSAGGTEACGRPIFESREDPDYQALLNTFAPIIDLLEKRPRMDMYGQPSDCSDIGGK